MNNGKNRGFVVLGAILMQLALGAIYAWSVFTPALSAKQSHEVIAVYAYQGAPAPQLDLDESEVQSLNNLLAEPVESLNQLKKQIQNSESEIGRQALRGQSEELQAQIDAAVYAFVPEEDLNLLTLGFSRTQTQVVFSLGLAFFALVMVLAGKKLTSWGPRKLAMISAVVLGLGYLAAGLFGGTGFWSHAILIGVVGGAGIGIGYVVPIAVGMRWFPDKKGMITGLAVAGFGFGAMFWVKIAGAWGHLIANFGLSTTFSIYGIAFFVLVAIGGIWMVFPPEGWKPSGWNPPANDNVAAPAAGTIDFNSTQMLATPQFWMIFLTFVVGAGAGLMSIGLMKLYPMEALQSPDITAGEAAAIAGTAMAVFFSLANGLGRILWGLLSDKLGRKRSIIIMTGSQGIFVIAFTFMAGTPWLLFLGATLIGFNFGGNFALFPTITADTFGTKNVGSNYPFIFLAYGVGGIGGPILGGKLGDLGNFPLAFTILGIACLVGAVLISLVKPPRQAA